MLFSFAILNANESVNICSIVYMNTILGTREREKERVMCRKNLWNVNVSMQIEYHDNVSCINCKL